MPRTIDHEEKWMILFCQSYGLGQLRISVDCHVHVPCWYSMMPKHSQDGLKYRRGTDRYKREENKIKNYLRLTLHPRICSLKMKNDKIQSVNIIAAANLHAPCWEVTSTHAALHPPTKVSSDLARAAAALLLLSLAR
jgi:hypothetical protein